MSDAYKIYASQEYVDEKVSGAIAEIPEGFSGSWNDLSDKPFYETPSAMGELLPETTIEPENIPIGNATGFYAPCKIDGIVAGNEYTVTIDSVSYTVIAQEAGGIVYFSDKERNILFESPYLHIEELNIVYGTTSWGHVGFCFTRDVHTYKVQGMVAGTTVQIDEKYIPDTIQRVGDSIILNSSTEGSTKKFKLTIDDSGVLTATEIVE